MPLCGSLPQETLWAVLIPCGYHRFNSDTGERGLTHGLWQTCTTICSTAARGWNVLWANPISASLIKFEDRSLPIHTCLYAEPGSRQAKEGNACILPKSAQVGSLKSKGGRW